MHVGIALCILPFGACTAAIVAKRKIPPKDFCHKAGCEEELSSHRKDGCYVSHFCHGCLSSTSPVALSRQLSKLVVAKKQHAIDAELFNLFEGSLEVNTVPIDESNEPSENDQVASAAGDEEANDEGGDQDKDEADDDDIKELNPQVGSELRSEDLAYTDDERNADLEIERLNQWINFIQLGETSVISRGKSGDPFPIKRLFTRSANTSPPQSVELTLRVTTTAPSPGLKVGELLLSDVCRSRVFAISIVFSGESFRLKKEFTKLDISGAAVPPKCPTKSSFHKDLDFNGEGRMAFLMQRIVLNPQNFETAKVTDLSAFIKSMKVSAGPCFAKEEGKCQQITGAFTVSCFPRKRTIPAVRPKVTEEMRKRWRDLGRQAAEEVQAQAMRQREEARLAREKMIAENTLRKQESLKKAYELLDEWSNDILSNKPISPHLQSLAESLKGRPKLGRTQSIQPQPAPVQSNERTPRKSNSASSQMPVGSKVTSIDTSLEILSPQERELDERHARNRLVSATNLIY